MIHYIRITLAGKGKSECEFAPNIIPTLKDKAHNDLRRRNLYTYGTADPAAHGVTRITIDLEVGVLLVSATLPIGTSTFVSGK